MVRAVCLTLAAIAACIAVFLTVDLYLKEQFAQFGDAMETLCEKTENELAVVFWDGGNKAYPMRFQLLVFGRPKP